MSAFIPVVKAAVSFVESPSGVYDIYVLNPLIRKEVSNQFARLLSLCGIGADEMVLIGTVLRQSAVIRCRRSRSTRH